MVVYYHVYVPIVVIVNKQNAFCVDTATDGTDNLIGVLRSCAEAVSRSCSGPLVQPNFYAVEGVYNEVGITVIVEVTGNC